MTTTLFSQTRGTGLPLTLLHGWGVNSGIWESIATVLQSHFRVTMIDLPGFGRNADVMPEPYTLHSVSNLVCEHLPTGTALLGWSLGGLIGQDIALRFPERVGSLITVASSPKFVKEPSWPGIRPDVLRQFEDQLEGDFSHTLDRFLAIQALGSATARKDIRQIRDQVQKFPIPAQKALEGGLSILSTTDLRSQLSSLQVPVHRIYGRLDSLVPHRVIEKVEALHTAASVTVMEKASHAPFISHPQEFADTVEKVLL